MNTATPIKTVLDNPQRYQVVYVLDPPYIYETFDSHLMDDVLDVCSLVLVSAIDFRVEEGEYGAFETYVFPCASDGTVLDWGAIPMSERGVFDHAKVLRNGGYEIVYTVPDIDLPTLTEGIA